MLLQDAKIPLGPWLPDLPFDENPGLVEAKNCIPADRHYTQYLPLTTSGDALSARVIGAFAALDTAGDAVTMERTRLLQGLQDHQVEGAVGNVRGWWSHQ